MIALQRSVSFILIASLTITSCKARKYASTVASENTDVADESNPPESFFEEQVKDLTSQRNLAIAKMKNERDAALELEKIGDGAKRIAKISTSFAIVGAIAGAAAGGMVALGYGSMTVSQAFAAALAYGKGLVAKYGYTRAIAMFGATKAVQGLVSKFALDYLTKSINNNIEKKIADDWDDLTPKMLLTLAQLNTNINEVKIKSDDAAKADTWLTYVKNSITFGWYDVSYVHNIQQSHAVLADLYSQKADAYGYLINDLQQRRLKLYGVQK